MAVTEQDLIHLGQALRLELAEKVEALHQELTVKMTEAHNRTAGLTADEVQALIREAVDGVERLTLEDVRQAVEEASTPGISADEVRALISENTTVGVTAEEVAELVATKITREPLESVHVVAAPFDDDELKGGLLRLRVFANELADRVGAPRMEG